MKVDLNTTLKELVQYAWDSSSQVKLEIDYDCDVALEVNDQRILTDEGKGFLYIQLAGLDDKHVKLIHEGDFYDLEDKI